MKLMNRIILISLSIISLLVSQCGNTFKKNSSGVATGDSGTVKIVFSEYEHNFGKVAEGEKVSYLFKFENRGTSNLVIAAATTTCGCTVPQYDSRPIPPGGSGNLEVVFDTSGRDGLQTKTITVKSNAQPPVVILKITAEVVPVSRKR
jgi:hypothetical protein